MWEWGCRKTGRGEGGVRGGEKDGRNLNVEMKREEVF